jgi:hypothetical protein
MRSSIGRKRKTTDRIGKATTIGWSRKNYMLPWLIDIDCRKASSIFGPRTTPRMTGASGKS